MSWEISERIPYFILNIYNHSDRMPEKLECLTSRDNLSSPLFALGTYRHVKNWFTHLLDKSQTTSWLDSNIYEPKISINDIYTSQWPFYYLAFKCDLGHQLTWTNVSNGTSTPRGQQLCQIILKSTHKCATNGLDKLSLYDLQVLKSMHKCTSYGPDKLNWWSFYHWTFKYDLDLQPTWKLFLMALLHL